MWNVYNEFNELCAEDCGSEENAWDVVELLEFQTDAYHYVKFVEVK